MDRRNGRGPRAGERGNLPGSAAAPELNGQTDGYLNSVNLNAEEPFPYLVLDVVDDDSRPRNPGFRVMHWHDDLQLIYVLEGQVEVVTLVDSVTVAAGEGLFINRGVVHLVRRLGACRYKSLIFPERLVGFYPGGPAAAFAAELAGDAAVRTYKILDVGGTGGDLLHHLRRLCDLGRGETPESVYAILVELGALWLGLTRATAPHRAAVPDATGERMRAFLGYIEGHYAEPLALEELAASAHVSKSECLRCFKASLGTTPHRYLVEYRLARAAELLRAGDEPVGTVATGVGFARQSHFGKCFKEKTGMTPAEYRRHARPTSASL